MNKQIYIPGGVTVYVGDCLESLREMPDESVNCCVTSPPYFNLRDYGHEGQIGMESTPDEFAVKLVEVFREVKRVLRSDGTLWLNLGDSYTTQGGPQTVQTCNGIIGASDTVGGGKTRKAPEGLKAKDLIGIPWLVAFALRADGWYLRSEIIWQKPNAMPESVADRPTKSHEQIFLLSKRPKYFYDQDAIAEFGANRHKFTGNEKYSIGSGRNDAGSRNTEIPLFVNARSVWNIATKPYGGAHFATFPAELARKCILAGCPQGGIVLDPFGGSGTTAEVARQLGHKAILCELNPDYVELMKERLNAEQTSLFDAIEAETALQIPLPT